MRRVVLALSFLLILTATTSSTLAGQIQGYVYTRSFALTESGNRIWVEYHPATGELVREIDEAAGDLSPREWRPLSALEYSGYVDQYEQLQSGYPENQQSEVVPISRAEYESRTFHS